MARERTVKETDEPEKRYRLSGARVTHISLVDTPANKRRIKWIKSTGGGDMKLRKMLGLEPKGPRVVAAFGETPEEAARVAKSVGIEGSPEDCGGVYRVGTDPAEGAVGIYAGNGSGYVIENATKALSTFNGESLSFSDVVNQEGFFPSLNLGMNALATTIMNAARSDEVESKEQFAEAVQNALTEFAGFASGLIENLPEQAFKFERDALAVSNQAPVEKSASEDDATGEEGATEGDETDDASGDEASAESADQAEDDAEAPAAEDPASGFDEGAFLERLSARIKPMIEAAVSEQVAPIRDDVSRVQEGLKTAEDKAEKAQKAISGFVPAGEAKDGSTPAREGARKGRSNGSSGGPAFIDTAFQGH